MLLSGHTVESGRDTNKLYLEQAASLQLVGPVNCNESVSNGVEKKSGWPVFRSTRSPTIVLHDAKEEQSFERSTLNPTKVSSRVVPRVPKRGKEESISGWIGGNTLTLVFPARMRPNFRKYI